MSSLHQAARSQTKFQQLIDAHRAGESLDVQDGDGATPLHHALLETVDGLIIPTPALTLLALGAAPDLPDAEGRRPLHLACLGGKTDAARTLIDLGADPAEPDGAGRTPADCLRAAKNQSLGFGKEIAAWLEGPPRPPTSLSLPAAVKDDRPDAVRRLRAGTDLERRDRSGDSAMHVAAHWSKALLAALLALGADPNATNRKGETALHVACQSLGPVRLLLDNGADPTIRDAAGKLPVDGLRAQDYSHDFYDGHRLESYRDAAIQLLEKHM